jgi:hypothetical protein
MHLLPFVREEAVMDENRPNRTGDEMDRTDEDIVGQDVDDFEAIEDLDDEEEESDEMKDK